MLQIIPYVGPIISGGLKPGMALYVQGTVPDNANQYDFLKNISL